MSLNLFHTIMMHMNFNTIPLIKVLYINYKPFLWNTLIKSEYQVEVYCKIEHLMVIE